jgi:hypothetical protein
MKCVAALIGGPITYKTSPPGSKIRLIEVSPPREGHADSMPQAARRSALVQLGVGQE